MRSKLIVAIALVVLFGCGKDYFTDGGTLDLEETAKLNVSTMDFLKSRPDVFDTLSALITLTGLETAVNASGNTFLAPKNYSIRNYFNLKYPDPEKRPKSFAEIPIEDLEAIETKLKNYIIPDKKIVRNELSTTYSYLNTFGDTRARFNVVRDDYLGNVNMGARFVIFSLNVGLPGGIEIYQSVTVETADLQSTNGIVHVLNADSHIFGFN